MEELQHRPFPEQPELRECPACIGRLKDNLLAQAGVEAVDMDAQGILRVRFDPERVSSASLLERARRQESTLQQDIRHLRYTIGGMDCTECARTIEKAVRRLPGVRDAFVNFGLGTLIVEVEGDAEPGPAIERQVSSLGYTLQESNGAQVTVFRVEGMDCADCAAKLEHIVASLEQVRAAKVNFGAGLLTVEHQRPDIIEAVQQQALAAGYRVEPAERAAQGTSVPWWKPRDRREWLTLASGLAWAAAGILHLAGAGPLLTIPFWAASIVLGGFPIARAGLAALRTARSIDMNLLMTVAVLGAAGIGEWAEAATVVFLFSIGHILEARTMDRARNAIQKLFDLSPRLAARLRDGMEEKVPVETLQVGDRILVRPGERIPMDGQVLAGRSSVDQSPITGESMPVEKGPGDVVYAGTLNGEGALEIAVTCLAQDNTLARIVHMVQEAQGSRAPSQRLVDRFAAVYTPVVLALAAGIAAVPPLALGEPFLPWLYRALTLLVISCPCALVISTPVAIVSALSQAARQGILIKGGLHLENAGRLKAVAFDKTGTLTRGRPVVTDLISFNGHKPEELLAIAASIEERSSHALSEAIVSAAQERGLMRWKAEDYRALAGQGAMARVNGCLFILGNARLMEQYALLNPEAREQLEALQGKRRSVVLVASREACEHAGGPHLIGAIGLADEPRPEAAEAVRRLRAAGISRIIMLTGDHHRVAEAIAGELGLDEYYAELLPAQKVQIVDELIKRYERVAMVGDGVNDAPALARATIGIAMGAAGTDVALETADVALMSDDLRKIADLVQLGRRTRRNIIQNVVFSLALKLTFLALAVAGMATLWMAVFADVGASLLVTLNGLRLLAGPRHPVHTHSG
ncbi:MAG: cadmium-translocating P-type ATPase [Anaerolineae bacterium]|nr:cadmium-translocating P-type ATPase [Anaerolineae bacterium]